MGTSLKRIIAKLTCLFLTYRLPKKRPALVVADWGGDDVILARITSIANKDVYALELKKEDFLSGSLMKTSFI